jgi:putative endonuclease
MVRCSDDTLYTGVTTDVARRLTEHNGTGRGAKYTKGRQPVELVFKMRAKDRSKAQMKEAKLKKMSREDKLIMLQK